MSSSYELCSGTRDCSLCILSGYVVTFVPKVLSLLARSSVTDALFANMWIYIYSDCIILPLILRIQSWKELEGVSKELVVDRWHGFLH